MSEKKKYSRDTHSLAEITAFRGDLRYAKGEKKNHSSELIWGQATAGAICPGRRDKAGSAGLWGKQEYGAEMGQTLPGGWDSGNGREESSSS